MNNIVYQECLSLLREGTEESIGRLFSIYRSGNKNKQKMARKALLAVKRQDIVVFLLDKQLNECSDNRVKFLLLNLGCRISREKYLVPFLVVTMEFQKGLPANYLNKLLDSLSLTLQEKEKLAFCIESKKEYDPLLFQAAVCAETEKPLFESLIAEIKRKGFSNASQIKLMYGQKWALDKVQGQILNALLISKKQIVEEFPWSILY